ncbi:hypothetical protein [Streptomyces paludis]|uniref:Uncharacterized protein n=1 Tax=Streptomyces paludis TaxID=2282738 RepID=A0A345I262_9ACTN|nr:hypothetical protein [Streptomyces paludis]AXG83036.1 hypothetical protein DVK44_31860 [Streptomyces paludis]
MSSLIPDVSARTGGTRRVLRAVARLVAAAALAWNAYLHARLADQYDTVSGTISQGDLFRIEAGLASLAALLVLAWRRVPGDLFAWLVAAGGLALLLVYRYVDVGTLGPVPNMYEPVWSTEKRLAAVAQAIAVLATILLLVTPSTRRRGRGAHAARGRRLRLPR